MVFHDESINHKTDEGGKVADLEYAELEEAKVGIAKEKILELSKVFEDFHSQERQWIFDIKTTGIEKTGGQSSWMLNWKKDCQQKQVILFGSYEVMQEYKRQQNSPVGLRFYGAPLENAARATLHARSSPGTLQTFGLRLLGPADYLCERFTY